MKNQVVKWWGYPVRKEKYVCKIGDNFYWWVTFLTNQRMEMVVLKGQDGKPS